MADNKPPDFDSIKQISPYGAEYWSARELMPLLGYTRKWQNFEAVIGKAMIACTETDNVIELHFTDASKVVKLGSGAEREVKDYYLSRLACYLTAQNGDPRKPEVAAAQLYFAISTRENEIAHLLQAQEERIRLRERVSENNKALSEAAAQSGVQSPNFGIFHDAGYKGLYGGLGAAQIKVHKQIPQREELLDRMGRAELAANDFRITQAEERLRKEQIIGETLAIDVHHEVGKKVRKAIEDIGGTMPEELPPEPSIKPLIDARQRKVKKQIKQQGQSSLFNESTEDEKS